MSKKQLLIDHISNVTFTDIVNESGTAHSHYINLINEGVQSNISSISDIVLVGIIQKADTRNGNGRIYPKSTLEREVNRFIENIVKTGSVAGELDHPESTVIELKNSSHQITEIWWEGTNVMAKIKLLNTPSGRIAQELVKAKVPLGISSRGMGSIKQIGETLQVGDDFDLLCFDLVSVPSTPGAYLYPDNNSLKENKIIPEVKINTKYETVHNLMYELLSSK